MEGRRRSTLRTGSCVVSPATYPRGSHDDQGKEAGCQHVPHTPAVQLQRHGDDEGARHTEDLQQPEESGDQVCPNCWPTGRPLSRPPT